MVIVEINFTGRHQNVGEMEREYIISKLERIVRNIPKVNNIHVIIDSERFRFKVEVVIHLFHAQIRAAEKEESITAAFDEVLDKLTSQLRKYKDKLQDHRKKVKILVPKEPAGVKEIEGPRLNRVKKFEAKPMSVDEAWMQLQVLDEDLIVFVNSLTNSMNVIFRQKDGNYGWIEPELRGKRK